MFEEPWTNLQTNILFTVENLGVNYNQTDRPIHDTTKSLHTHRIKMKEENVVQCVYIYQYHNTSVCYDKSDSGLSLFAQITVYVQRVKCHAITLPD